MGRNWELRKYWASRMDILGDELEEIEIDMSGGRSKMLAISLFRSRSDGAESDAVDVRPNSALVALAWLKFAFDSMLCWNLVSLVPSAVVCENGWLWLTLLPLLFVTINGSCGGCSKARRSAGNSSVKNDLKSIKFICHNFQFAFITYRTWNYVFNLCVWNDVSRPFK